MKKFNSYKDSGISWIGEIPKHWNITKAKLCSDFRMGQTILKEDVNDEGDFPVYSATEGDHYFGRINNPSFILEPGDIVIPARGNSIGFVALVHELSVSTQTTIANFIDKSKMNSKYVFYFYKGFRHTLFHFNATAIPQITVDQVKQNPIICPPLNEQTSIANYLDQKTTQIDELIAKKERLIQLLEEERTAIINHAVTKGLVPNVSMKDSGIEWLGDVPEHWEVYRIDWITNIVRGNTGFKKDELLENGEYIALQYGKTYKVDIVDDRFNFFVNSEFYKENQTVLKGDTILISTSETIEDLGHSCYYNNENIGLLGGEQILLSPNRKYLNEKFLYLCATQFHKELKKYATGTKVFRFSTHDLKKIFIAIPPIEVQIEIANFLDSERIKVDSLISKMKREIELLKEYKAALISEVVTGKVDVRDWQPMNKN